MGVASWPSAPSAAGELAESWLNGVAGQLGPHTPMMAAAYIYHEHMPRDIQAEYLKRIHALSGDKVWGPNVAGITGDPSSRCITPRPTI